MGPAQTHCALDDSNLAVRVDHRGICVFDALPMVSSRKVAMCPVVSAVSADSQADEQINALRTAHSTATAADSIICVMLSLAFGNYLMFDHTMRCRASEKNYGDYCDVQ